MDLAIDQRHACDDAAPVTNSDPTVARPVRRRDQASTMGFAEAAYAEKEQHSRGYHAAGEAHHHAARLDNWWCGT